MQRIALTDPTAQPLAELVRRVPAFSGLPQETNVCLHRLRQATVERYQSGEVLARDRDVLVVCAGALAATPGLAFEPGAVIDERRLKASMRAAEPSLVLRLTPATISALRIECPAITAGLDHALALTRYQSERATDA